MQYSPLLTDLIKNLQSLQGIGAKSAQRIAFNLLSGNRGKGLALARSLADAMNGIGECSCCRNFTEEELCPICSSKKRIQEKTICVVENPADVTAIEAASEYFGIYFVLHGKISPLDGIGPEELRLDQLESLIERIECRELIIAINPSVDGSMTSFYIADLAKKHNVKVTTLAQGIPMGGEIDNMDQTTISYSFSNRRSF